jgi:hypothetical protein
MASRGYGTFRAASVLERRFKNSAYIGAVLCMCAAASFTVHHFLNPAEEQTQILSFSRQALVKKFFPDYTRLTSLADGVCFHKRSKA